MPRRTFILCDNKHVIGEVIFDQLYHEKVSVAYVYENSVATEAEVPARLPQKRFVAIGQAKKIECSICRSETDWKISNRAAITLMTELLNSLYEPGRKHNVINRDV